MPPHRNRDTPSSSNSPRLSGCDQRPYRSKKQKPCTECRKRRVGCVRQGNSPCKLCNERSLRCIVEAQTVKGATDDMVSLARNEVTEGRKSGYTPKTNLLPDEDDAQLQSHSKHTAQHVGPTSDHDAFILRHDCWVSSNSPAMSSVWARRTTARDKGSPVLFTIFSDEDLDAHPHYYPRNVVEEAVEPFRGELVETYFTYVHASYALLGPQTVSNIADSAVLRTSMYALAQRHCPAAQELDPWLFTDFNKQALNIERHAAKLETVEAALLFAQRHAHVIRAPTMPGMCAEVGSIVGMSHDLGLNVDPINWTISDAEKRRRRRLWWGVYMLDKWSALTLGRPSYLHGDQNDVSMLSTSDFAEVGCLDPSPSNIQPAQQFIAMATLTCILSKILNKFFSLKIMSSGFSSSTEMESLFGEIEQELEDWRAESLQPILLDKSFPDSSGCIEVAFYTVQIALYRGAMCASGSEAFGGSPFWTSLSSKARTVAESLVKLLEQLPIARSSAFWWSTSKLNFSIAGSFMIKMYLSSLSESERKYWMDKFNFYRKLLRAHAPGFEMTKHASIRLDLLANNGAIFRNTPSVVDPPNDGDENSVVEEVTTPHMQLRTSVDEDWFSWCSGLPPNEIYAFGMP